MMTERKSNPSLSPRTLDKLTSITAQINNPLKQWLAPAILISVVGASVTSGIWWGRNETRLELARIEERLSAHSMLGVHPSAVPRAELQAELRAIRDRLSSIETLIRQSGPE